MCSRLAGVCVRTLEPLIIGIVAIETNDGVVYIPERKEERSSQDGQGVAQGQGEAGRGAEQPQQERQQR